MVDLLALRLFLILSLFSAALQAGTLADAIDSLDMQNLAATYSESRIESVIDGAGRGIGKITAIVFDVEKYRRAGI